MEYDIDDMSTQFARLVSIETRRMDPSYRFSDFSVEATTRPNTGIVKGRWETFTNKCFFISICHALESYRVRINPMTLMARYHFFNNRMVDTDQDLMMIEKLVHDLSIKLECYIGRYDSKKKKWLTTPDPSTIIGNGKYLIRILNKGMHFEHLIILENGFIPQINSTVKSKVCSEQKRMLDQTRQAVLDAKVAEYIQEQFLLDQEEYFLSKEELLLERERKLLEEQKQLREKKRLQQERLDELLARQMSSGFD